MALCTSYKNFFYEKVNGIEFEGSGGIKRKGIGETISTIFSTFELISCMQNDYILLLYCLNIHRRHER